MFMTLIVVMGSCVYTYLQSYKVIHIKYIQLFERKKKKLQAQFSSLVSSTKYSMNKYSNGI